MKKNIFIYLSKILSKLSIWPLFFTAAASATTTNYTTAGKPYMGWHSTHVQQFGYGINPSGDHWNGLAWDISEQFVKNQTDWMAANFKNYGYHWICLDGWTTGTRHNADGYVTTQSNDWLGGWTEMASYVHSKGMKFGAYYNPMWVLKTIANNTAIKVKGTSYTIKSITNENKTFENSYLIDTDKNGAEQYVKGMIQYFIDCGVDLLKVDFLAYYETAYGHEKTVKLMRWMREAAGNNLILTLSIPNNFDDIKDEKNYGDNIRVVGDTVPDLWYHNSKDSMGAINKWAWPLACNVYDGLAYTSFLTGKGKFFATPDFVTFHSRNGTDDQKKFAATIRFVSGAPVEFGDSYFDIEGNTNANYLRNSELTSLNAEGFFGKPLSRVFSDVKNQIWTGTTANGDRIVALFNRGDNAQTRSVNFLNDLGLAGSHNVRNLWSHTNVGYLASFSASVPANGVVVIRIYVGNTPPANGDPLPPSPLVGVIPTNGTYIIINKNSGKILNVPGGSAGNGTQLVQWVRSSHYNEKWKIMSVGGGYYSITNVSSGKCVTVSGASQSDGAAIVQWDYTNGSNNKWKIIDSGGGYYKFVNQNSGKCMTIQYASTSDGGSAIQWSYNGGDNDQWQVHLIPEVGPPNGTYRIKNKNSGKVLNVPGNSTADGTQLIQWIQSSGNNDQWIVTDTGGGNYKIVNVNNNKCVTVLAASHLDGTGVGQWTYYGGLHDHWRILDSGGGYYRIISQNSGKCMTIQNASTSDGGSAIQWNYNGGNNDQWDLIPTP